MEKYGDMTGEGEEAEVIAGLLKGTRGIVKRASAGKVILQVSNGAEVELDETAVALTAR
jgi:hypothetical protein